MEEKNWGKLVVIWKREPLNELGIRGYGEP